jgi:hypothetical protein
VLPLIAALFCVLANGFFVAAEFALAKVRATSLEARAKAGDAALGARPESSAAPRRVPPRHAAGHHPRVAGPRPAGRARARGDPQPAARTPARPRAPRRDHRGRHRLQRDLGPPHRGGRARPQVARHPAPRGRGPLLGGHPQGLLLRGLPCPHHPQHLLQDRADDAADAGPGSRGRQALPRGAAPHDPGLGRQGRAPEGRAPRARAPRHRPTGARHHGPPSGHGDPLPQVAHRAVAHHGAAAGLQPLSSLQRRQPRSHRGLRLCEGSALRRSGSPRARQAAEGHLDRARGQDRRRDPRRVPAHQDPHRPGGGTNTAARPGSSPSRTPWPRSWGRSATRSPRPASRGPASKTTAASWSTARCPSPIWSSTERPSKSTRAPTPSGGLVVALLGRLAGPGDRIEIGAWEGVVEDVRARRVHRVRFRKMERRSDPDRADREAAKDPGDDDGA